MASTAYAFSSVIVLVGDDQIVGFAEGDDAISITQNPDRTNKVVGAGGDVVFNKSEDDTAQIDLKLQTTSESNAVLEDLFDEYNETNQIPDTSIQIRDLSGNTIWYAQDFVVKGPPDSQRGVNSGDQTWTILTGSLDTNFDED
jgi:hypothetical protein